MLFYYFKWTFYSGVAVLAIGIGINYFLAIINARMAKIVLSKKDKRMNMMTEILKNIKTIKLN